jgi:hypothetical protein
MQIYTSYEHYKWFHFIKMKTNMLCTVSMAK